MVRGASPPLRRCRSWDLPLVSPAGGHGWDARGAVGGNVAGKLPVCQTAPSPRLPATGDGGHTRKLGLIAEHGKGAAARVAADPPPRIDAGGADRHCRWCTEGIEMSDTTKPDYLGLLNRISLAERNAGIYLKAWADVTPDAGLRRALALVAARETTHAEVFRQRIERLGFSLIEHDDPELVERDARTATPRGPTPRRSRGGAAARRAVRRRGVLQIDRPARRGRVGGFPDARHAPLVRRRGARLARAALGRIRADRGDGGRRGQVAAGARGRTRAAPSSINRPWVVRSARPRALTTPADTVDWNPRGLPIAITSWPDLERAPRRPAGRRATPGRSGGSRPDPWSDPRRPGPLRTSNRRSVWRPGAPRRGRHGCWSARSRRA